MGLRDVLEADRDRVAALRQVTEQLLKALRDWERQSADGALPGRERAATKAAELARGLAAPLADAAGAFDFDLADYLGTDAWREELHTVASEAGLKLLEEGEQLICSPVVIRAQPASGRLMIGKRSWTKLHPDRVVEQLRKLQEQGSTRSAAETLRALHQVWLYKQRPAMLKLREAYELFCLTPGYKREVPETLFAQRLRGLEVSGLTDIKGDRLHFEWPSANVKARDVITFLDEHGRAVKYYGVSFA